MASSDIYVWLEMDVELAGRDAETVFFMQNSLESTSHFIVSDSVSTWNGDLGEA